MTSEPYEPKPGDVVHIGGVSPREWTVVAVFDDRAWITQGGEDKVKPLARLTPKATETDVAQGHYLDEFLPGR